MKRKIDLSIKICKDNSAVIGKDIKVIKNTGERRAKVLDLDKEGKLLVQYEDDSRERLISGEISIRGLNEYIK